MSCLGRICLVAALLAVASFAQALPEGKGRVEMEKMCRQCHELARSISPRQDREGWNQIMTKMAAFGMKSTAGDYQLVLDYLAKNYPAEDVPRVNVNTATAIELESTLNLRRSQSRALLAYREEHGNFKSLDDLKKVPSLEGEKIEAKRDRITF